MGENVDSVGDSLRVGSGTVNSVAAVVIFGWSEIPTVDATWVPRCSLLSFFMYF